MAGTFSNLSVHLVFSTKERLPLMTMPIRDKLFPYMGGIVNGLGGTIITVGGMPDHVHLVARLPTSLSVADVVRTVKTNSSKWMNEEFTTMKFGWQRGYGAFSVSHSALPALRSQSGATPSLPVVQGGTDGSTDEERHRL